MKRITILTLLIGLVVTATVACGGRGAPAATPDTQATVKAAIAATSTAHAGTQATIDAAVQATTAAQTGAQVTAGAAAQGTSEAQAGVQATTDAAVQATTAAQASAQATADAAVQATVVAQTNVQATVDAVQATVAAAPTPTPSAEYVTMTEEELAALIDQAVAEATAATQASSAATTEATADDAVTQEEVITVAVSLAEAEEAIAYAEELISAYYDLYGELATETLATLQAIEEDLAVMAENTAAINASLQEINTTLEQGLALAEETIAQLEAAAQIANDKAMEAQMQTQSLVQNLQIELENLAATALSVQPNNVATDRQAAIQSALDYLGAVGQSLADNKISTAELANIAQLGANASASLSAQGIPQFQQLSGSINDITAQLARGQAPQAQANLGNLEASLGSLPSKPSRP
jgi:hypothetical protein